MRQIHPRNFQKAGKATIRRINRAIVLNVIRNHQPISRAEIARKTGLRNSTVCLIVDQLVADGFLEKGVIGPSSGGRKPKLMFLNSEKFLVLGADVGVTDTILGVANFNGEIVHQKRFGTDRDPKAFVRQLSSRVRQILEKTATSGCQELGVSIRGLVDAASGRIIFTPSLDWKDFDLRSRLEQETHLRVHIENNANACALAVMWFGNGHHDAFHDFVYITVNEGIGGGVVCNGQLVRGRTNGAGEFGHFPINEDGALCGCGRRGCWQAYASNVAMVQRYLDGDVSREKRRLQVAMRRLHTLSVPDLIRLARGNDPRARKALFETARYLGIGIATVLDSLDPEALIVGGDISLGWELVEPIIRAQVKARALSPAAAETPILPSEISGRPGLTGAIALVLGNQFVVPQVA